MRRLGSIALLLACVYALSPTPAAAVIEIKNTVAKSFETSKAVVVGTVTKVDGRVVEVKTTETLKGDPFPDAFRIQVTNPPELVNGTSAGQPVVLFLSARRAGAAVINLADTWLLANVVSGANPPAWRAAPLQDDTRKSFPGRTEALVKIVTEIKDKKPSSLLNAVDNKRLQGGVKELAKLPVAKPTFLLAADVNGDGKPDLLVGGEGGAVKLFLATGSGYEDATAKWGLSDAKGTRAAFGDINRDGKPDLLIGTALFVNEGQRFKRAAAALDVPAAGPIVAESLIDINGDAKPDAAVLLADGQLLTFTNLGLPDQPWTKGTPRKLTQAAPPLAAVFGDFGDNGKPHAIVVTPGGITRHPIDADAGSAPADFERLTGERLASQKGFAEPLKAAGAAVLDLNGDKRPDVIVVGDGGDLVLVNRGFGAFLIDPDASRPLAAEGDKPLPAKITPSTAWTTADLAGDGTDDVLVLTEDGRLLAIDNPPAPR
jgi:hypothetical protein